MVEKVPQVIQMDLEIQIFPYFRSVGEGEVGEGMCVCVCGRYFARCFRKRVIREGRGELHFYCFAPTFTAF